MKALSALQSVNNCFTEINYSNEYDINNENYTYVKTVSNTEIANTYFTMAHLIL